MNRNRKRYLARHHNHHESGDLSVEIVSGKLKRTYYIIWWGTLIGFAGIVALIIYAAVTDNPQPPHTGDPVKDNNGWKFIPIFAVFIVVLYIAPIILKEKSSFINTVGRVVFAPGKCIVEVNGQRTEFDHVSIETISFEYSGFMGQISAGGIYYRSPNPTYSGVENYLTLGQADNYIRVQLVLETEYQAEKIKQEVGHISQLIRGVSN